VNLDDCGLAKEDVLFTASQIEERLGELAEELDRRYAGSDLLMIGVLTGAFMVVADLCRMMSTHVEIDWVGVSSYGASSRSSGTIQMTKELKSDVTGREVLIVDDILDSGLTLSWLTSMLESNGAASVESCVLLRKPARAGRVDARYVGFDIPDVFAVGFGLDHAGQYRNLRCVAAADKHANR
jgi:hypoxanthine phosphoribosyltransferase